MTESTIKPLLESLACDANPEVRHRVLMQLTELLDGSALETVLATAIVDADTSVVAQAAKQLGNLYRKQQSPAATVLESLEQLATSSDPDVAFESARAIVLGVHRLRSDMPSVVPVVLTQFLRDPETHPAMLGQVVGAIGLLQEGGGFIDDLSKLLEHAQPEVREQAARALGRMGAVAASTAAQLVICLDDEEPFVREYAAVSLGQIGVNSAEVLAALELTTADEDDEVALVAKAALEHLRAR